MNLVKEGVEAFYERLGKRAGEHYFHYFQYKKRDKGHLSAENAPIGLGRL